MAKEVEFKIYNKTASNFRFGVIQQDTEIRGLFEYIFPVVWKVKALPGTNPNSQERIAIWNFTYSSAVQIGVKVNSRYLPEAIRRQLAQLPRSYTLSRQRILARDNESVEIISDANEGQRWKFFLDTQGYPALELEANPNPTTAITVTNMFNKEVDISIYKEDIPFITQFNVKPNLKVDFYNPAINIPAGYPLSAKLWVMYSDYLEQGECINRFVEAPAAQGVDLQNLSKVTLLLYESGGRVEWEVDTL